MISKREQDGADERDQQVERREGEAEVDPDHLQHQPAEHARQAVADGDSEQPAGERDREALGGEDAADLAGAGADAAEDADLARPLEHAHRDRVDEADHADRDDQQAEHADRGRDRLVLADVGALAVST